MWNMAYFNIQPYNIIRRAYMLCVFVMYMKCELTGADTVFFYLLFLPFLVFSIAFSCTHTHTPLIPKSILPRTLFCAIGCYLSRNCSPRVRLCTFPFLSLSLCRLSLETLCIHASRYNRMVEYVCPKQQNVVSAILICCCMLVLCCCWYHWTIRIFFPAKYRSTISNIRFMRSTQLISYPFILESCCFCRPPPRHRRLLAFALPIFQNASHSSWLYECECGLCIS